jgi:hypothetical protein
VSDQVMLKDRFTCGLCGRVLGSPAAGGSRCRSCWRLLLTCWSRARARSGTSVAAPAVPCVAAAPEVPAAPESQRHRRSTMPAARQCLSRRCRWCRLGSVGSSAGLCLGQPMLPLPVRHCQSWASALNAFMESP